jgi:transcription elongation factor Elf1
MAKRIGHCPACGQEFSRSRIAGRENGYRIVSDEKHGTMIQCLSCEQKTTINEPIA